MFSNMRVLAQYTDTQNIERQTHMVPLYKYYKSNVYV